MIYLGKREHIEWMPDEYVRLRELRRKKDTNWYYWDDTASIGYNHNSHGYRSIELNDELVKRSPHVVVK